MVGDFQREIGDEGLFLSPPVVIFGFALAGCPISTRMRTIITDVLNIFTMTYDHGILLVEQDFAEGKGAEQGGFGGNVEARRYKYPWGVFVDFASKPPDSFSLSSLFNRATITNTS